MVGEKKIKVEVKSSIPPKNESYENIIRFRDIKITASHDNGINMIPLENLISDIHIQIYFYASTYKQGYDNFEKLYNDISVSKEKIKKIINIKKYYEPLFFGWNYKQEIINNLNTLSQKTWTFSWTNRIYWKCPISKAKNLSALVDFIDKN